jgi:hypothetical protein
MSTSGEAKTCNTCNTCRTWTLSTSFFKHDTYDTQSQHIRSISQHLHKSVDSCDWKVRVGAEKQWLLRCQLDRLDMDPKDSGIPGMYSPRHNA